jgi:hypothetical protein
MRVAAPTTMTTMTSAPYVLAALVALLGCSTSVSSGGSGPGGAGPGSAGSGAAGGAASQGSGGGSAGAPVKSGAAASVGSGAAASVGSGTGGCGGGDPDCACASSDIIEECRCQCGDQLVEVDGNYDCISLEGTWCAGGTGGQGGTPTYADCEVIGWHKVCGP